ncbi:MAG: hypothetical protein IPI67_14375 [Myxococcales bacterium]|nr:hypothetical protein [Myxococcales bacterium]
MTLRPVVGFVGVAACALLDTFSAPAAAADAVPVEEDADAILSTDSWFLRLDVGAAYLRTTTRFHPVADDSQKSQFEPNGVALTLQLAIAARLGRDVTLGGLGRLVHSPANNYEGTWHDTPQGLYYGALFIDHRLPARVLRLGGGIGPGHLYSVDPAQQGFGQWGPVGTIWLGLDLPSSSRVALGLTADVTGAAMRQTHELAGAAHQFDTFMLVMGLSFTIRISEPSWPKSMPSLAMTRPPAHPSGGGS